MADSSVPHPARADAHDVPERVAALVNVIGPALRGLLAEGPALKIVRYVDRAPAVVTESVAANAYGDDPPLRITLGSHQDLAGESIVAVLRETLTDHRKKHGKNPRTVVVKDVGQFEAVDIAAAGRAAGKVAVVTGAAQGFGREIARTLAEDGAIVVLADIQTEVAQAAAAEICQAAGPGWALGLAIDVCDPVSIARCLHHVVRAYGGFDLLISNAGVLRAESVKTQSEEDFDFVTSVNYKGYFFCVQKAAPILAAQHMARPEYWSDIIQINSKSGLQGSNRNGAYAGSKFGCVGLTQSFALELIADGIKVNAICPGNFFEGPLWSDPVNGLFAQYLRTGKVAGAKSVADIKKFYEAKVPMGRGCTTADVMKALYYLMDQQYETGQALPVTGGQVMLS